MQFIDAFRIDGVYYKDPVTAHEFCMVFNLKIISQLLSEIVEYNTQCLVVGIKFCRPSPFAFPPFVTIVGDFPAVCT